MHWQVLVLAAAGSIAMMGTPVLAAMNSFDDSALVAFRNSFTSGTSPPSWMGGPTCSTTGTTGWLGVKCDSDPSATNQRLTEIDLTIAGPGGTPWTTGAGQLSFGSLSSDEALAFLKKLILKDNARITGPNAVTGASALALFDVRFGVRNPLRVFVLTTTP